MTNLIKESYIDQNKFEYCIETDNKQIFKEWEKKKKIILRSSAKIKKSRKN